MKIWWVSFRYTVSPLAQSHLQHDALRARVTDTNAIVIETLYSEPQIIFPIIANERFIESVSSALAALDVSRPVMRLHFAFVAAEFCRHNMDLAPVIFEHIYLPYILFTKPRQKTAALVWQSLRHSKLADYELLAGCMDIVFAQSAAEGVSRSVEDMATLNMAVTRKIAGSFREPQVRKCVLTNVLAR